jgi:hypothetical protein
MYVYLRSEPNLFTVGFYDPSGKWHSESDCGSSEEAAGRAAFLNGALPPSMRGRAAGGGFADVEELYAKFPTLPRRPTPGLLDDSIFGMRSTFMLSEVLEYQDAHWHGDLVKAADSLIDLVYVVFGTAIAMGIPWEACWAHVHRANMAKEILPDASGGYKHSLAKPEGWQSPDDAIRRELAKAGAPALCRVWQPERVEPTLPDGWVIRHYSGEEGAIIKGPGVCQEISGDRGDAEALFWAIHAAAQRGTK